MPEKAKVLAEDEEVLLDISELESMIPEYSAHTSDELEQVVLKLFAPHASEAQNKYNERKSRHMAREKWKEVIINNLQTQQQLNARNFVEKAKLQQQQRNNNGNGGISP